MQAALPLLLALAVALGVLVAPTSAWATGTRDMYRLYSGTNHHYTTSASECDNLVRVGWKLEGIGWYGVKGCRALSPACWDNGQGVRHLKNNPRRGVREGRSETCSISRAAPRPRGRGRGGHGRTAHARRA